MNVVLNFLRGILPSAKLLASFTKTDLDDKIVAILEGLVANPQRAEAVHAAMSEKGLLS